MIAPCGPDDEIVGKLSDTKSGCSLNELHHRDIKLDYIVVMS